jgi:cysteine desulfurase
MDRIYLDHAATTPLDNEILEKMLPYFTQDYGNADSPHGLGRKAMNAVDSARDALAEAINAKPNEVYFTSGGTEADNWAVIGGALAMRAKGRAHVVISSIEHHAVLYAGEQLERLGFRVTYLPVNKGGMVALNALKEAVDEQTALVAIMSANNETGCLQPIRECAEIAHNCGALFFTDGVQLAPYMPIDVKTLGVDMLSLSAHKFYGPKGCGALYIKNGVKIEKLVGGGEQERGLRGGTTNVPAVVGLSAAYLKNKGTMSATNEKLKQLRAAFLEELSPLEGVSINGEGECLPGILNLRFAGVLNTDLLYNLDLQGICISVGSACASASVKPSHVLLTMGLTESEAKESVRFSFGKDNTEAQIRFAAQKSLEIVRRLRG